MDSIQNVVIKLTAETSEATSRLDSAGASLGKIAAIGAGVSAAIVGAAVAFDKITERGQQVNELTSAFENLYGKTTAFGGSIEPLRNALGGLVGDLDLLKSANVAALAGLTPERFLAVAGAADALGDAVGKGAGEALDDLSRAVALGNERLLKQYGIVIDSEKAQQSFAKSIGTTVEFLNDEGKAEANRIEMLRQIAEKQSTLGESTSTVRDELDKLNNQWDRFINYITDTINKAPALVGFFENLNLAIEATFNTTTRSQIADLDAEIKELQTSIQEAIKSTNGAISSENDTGFAALVKQLDEADKKRAELTAGMAKTKESVEKVGAAATTAGGDVGKFLDQGKIDTYNQKLEETRQKFADMVSEFNQGGSDLKLDNLKLGIENAVKSLNKVSFDSLTEQFRSSEFDRALDELKIKYRDVLNKPGGLTLEELQTRATEIANTSGAEFAKAWDEEAKKAFQDSVDFFADILTTTITGSAQDIEEILTDALKRVAIGFASQILASMAAAAGLNISGITSAQGLGQSLGASVINGLGLGGGLSAAGISGGSAAAGIGGASLLGSFGGGAGVMLADGSVVAAGSAAAAGGVGSAAMPATGVLGALGPWGVAAAVATTLGVVFREEINKFFGGGITNAETIARNGAREWMQENTPLGENLSFQGVRGQLSLMDRSYNVDTSNPLIAGAIPMVSPLAQIIGQGDDKLSNDLTGIFANAVGEAQNFNEVIIQSAALMKGLGMDAGQAKDDLTNLFLDGKVSAEDFASGIHNLNIIASEDLTGPNSVADALRVVSDEMATPRAQLKGLELAFKEMAQQGIDSTAEIHAYLIDKYGPDVTALFDQLGQSGIDSWEDIANATSDQIALIFQILTPLLDAMRSGFGEAASSAGKAFVKNTNPILDRLSEISDKARETADALRMSQSSGGGGLTGLASNLWTPVGAKSINDNKRNAARSV